MVRTTLSPLSCTSPAHIRSDPTVQAFTFLGQTTGSSVGPKLFLRDGWRASYAFNVAFVVGAIAFLCARGPHAKGWVGWDGVWTLRKEPRSSVAGDDEEKGEADQVAAAKKEAGQVGQETAVEDALQIDSEAEEGQRHKT